MYRHHVPLAVASIAVAASAELPHAAASCLTFFMLAKDRENALNSLSTLAEKSLACHDMSMCQARQGAGSYTMCSSKTGVYLTGFARPQSLSGCRHPLASTVLRISRRLQMSEAESV